MSTIHTRVLQETAVRYFLEVVRRGSITEAAVTLNVASSAISRQIARLEAELDTPLFERVSRGMRPNAAGELLAAHALRIAPWVMGGAMPDELGAFAGERFLTDKVFSHAH